MARNEEKQQGRLNRLWLQREREEGRLKDGHERRPKLSTLNAASSVKKWIPSIKNEIEYYLQQSQLSHYPERKIAEFQLQIEALEREYKRFITKLRVLDPSCRHKPWTPRAYCKRRVDTQEPTSAAKIPRRHESQDGNSQQSGGGRGLACSWTGGLKTPVLVSTNPLSETSEAACADQDQPLSFDRTRLAVATAAFRGRPAQSGSPQTQSLARVLQSGLPNLASTSLRPTSLTDRENDDRSPAESTHGNPSVRGSTEEGAAHVLGLDCYSSSDEDL